MIGDICNALHTAYERYPDDPVIRQVSFVIEKMAEKSPSETINQAAISQIYNHFVRLSENSKFRSVLGHLLLDNGIGVTGTNKNDFIKHMRIDANDSDVSMDVVDYDVVNSLSPSFDSKMGQNTFDQKMASCGADMVKAELRSLGYHKPHITILGGNRYLMVYAAQLDTNKGLVTVAIPTEIKCGRVLFPGSFVMGDKLEDLTADNLNSFINKVAGNAEERCVAGDTNKTAIALDEHSLTSLYGTTPVPSSLEHLARDFENNVLEAASSFGLEAIRTGKLLIARELAAAGFKNAQVKFGSELHDSVIYAASINTPKGPVEIEVPTEMVVNASGKFTPLAPSYFAYDGLVEDFTAAKLQRFAINIPSPSTQSVTCSTALTYMTLPELKDEILKAASENDYIVCEAALSEIQEKYPEEIYKNAVSDYHFLLSQKSAINNVSQQCSKMIPAGKYSIYPMCGHLHVPMYKVIVGSDGMCRLKSTVEREKLNPIDETSASISTSKINLT
jgi:hypothetical protein